MLWKTGYSLWPQANDDLCQREPRSQTNTNTYENPNELLKLSCKITGVTKETLVSSHSTILSFSEKNGKICVLFSWKRWSDQHKTNCFPAKYAQKIAMKSAVFYWSFSAKFALRISVNFLWNQLFFCEFDFFSWPTVSEALLRVCHHQHLLCECEASLLCRHERSCCLIDKVYCKECFDFEGSTAMKTVTVVILESRPFRSGFVLFPFAFLHPSCGAALSIRFEV